MSGSVNSRKQEITPAKLNQNLKLGTEYVENEEDYARLQSIHPLAKRLFELMTAKKKNSKIRNSESLIPKKPSHISWPAWYKMRTAIK